MWMVAGEPGALPMHKSIADLASRENGRDKPRSLPTHMLVAEVVGGEITESHAIHEVLIDPHILSPESSSYSCFRLPHPDI